RVLLAEDGNEAVEMYNREKGILCIIRDVVMPGMDGRELAKYNYDNKLLPFIICTSMTEAKIALDLIRFGVQNYVVKPFTPPQLLGVVSLVVHKKKGARPVEDTGGAHPWQVGAITFLSTRKEIYKANEWIRRKLGPVFEKRELGRFINFLSEFILNALEHGNLGIGEQEKQSLVEGGTFEEEVALR
ncbi:MAG: response regulator, partial [Nitrospinota bacterium]